jgi:hypothetical protein
MIHFGRIDARQFALQAFKVCGIVERDTEHVITYRA